MKGVWTNFGFFKIILTLYTKYYPKTIIFLSFSLLCIYLNKTRTMGRVDAIKIKYDQKSR